MEDFIIDIKSVLDKIEFNYGDTYVRQYRILRFGKISGYENLYWFSIEGSEDVIKVIIDKNNPEKCFVFMDNGFEAYDFGLFGFDYFGFIGYKNGLYVGVVDSATLFNGTECIVVDKMSDGKITRHPMEWKEYKDNYDYDMFGSFNSTVHKIAFSYKDADEEKNTYTTIIEII